MTVKEGRKMVEELRKEGLSDENIVAGFYQLFIDDVINIDQLGDLVKLVGWEITEEFKKLSPEEQKTMGWELEEDE